MFANKIRTAYALGIGNLLRVFSYRFGIRLGLNPVRRLKGSLPAGPFFHPCEGKPTALPASRNWWERALYFGWWPLDNGGQPPNWHVNPMTGQSVDQAGREWWRIPDFDPNVGDIKAVWETSRFDWLIAFAQRASDGDEEAIARLNGWLTNWCESNPAYCGPNWKCGQEASIRVMHLAMAALIMKQARQPTSSLLDLIEAHLRRIEPTLGYALAQDNNHGTSEAAALYIGGSWLALMGRKDTGRWQAQGCRWLENRAGRLIEADGSFSQYSLNYHRVMLDTYGMVEAWRRYMDLPHFSERLYERLRFASHWLFSMVCPETGDGPNLGANDGARLLPLTDTDYRDYRPSVQLAMVLFAKTRAYDEGQWNLPLTWLNIPLPERKAALPSNEQFDNGGYAVLRIGRIMAMLRYPRFRFRPSQADALHVDLWIRGENHLRDAGTYSYNTAPEWLIYFPGTVSHNTIQFDDRDQMPRLSRFLFGNWLKTRELKPLIETSDCVECGVSYQDGWGATHARVLTLREDRLIVRDEIFGFARKAILRWRLRPGSWRVDGQTVTDGYNILSIDASMPVIRFALVQGWESRYYLQKTETPVLEVEVNEPGVLTTEYHWQP